MQTIETTLLARKQITFAAYQTFCKATLAYLNQTANPEQYTKELAALGQRLCWTFVIDHHTIQSMLQCAHTKVIQQLDHLAQTNTDLQPRKLFQEWLTALDEAWCQTNRHAKWHRGMAVKMNMMVEKMYEYKLAAKSNADTRTRAAS